MYKLSQYNVVIKEKETNKLIFNSRTQALSWISSEIYGNLNNCTKEEQYRLKKLGFIVESNRDEYEELLFEKNAFVFNTNPRQVGYVIAPTMKCNMKCKYCFENDVENKLRMTKETADEVIDFIKKQLGKNPNIESLNIRWFGGEPCLEIDIMEHIATSLIEFCKNNEIHYNSFIVSNGSLLDREMALRLEAIKVKRVQITLDGFEKTYSEEKGVDTGVFRKVIDNICEINDILKVIVRINVSDKNKDEIEDLSKYLLIEKELNNKIWIYYELVRDFSQNNNKNGLTPCEFEDLKHSIINHLINLDCVDSLLHYLPQRNIFSCGAMQCKSATIGPKGELYRCDNGLGKSAYIIGTCQNGFARNKIENLFLLSEYNSGCRECNLLPICGGGCLEDRLIEKHEKVCEATQKKLINDIEVYLEYKERSTNHGTK